MTTSTLSDRILGCLYGGAIGDAPGAPAEGRTPEAIRARIGAITDFRVIPTTKEYHNAHPLRLYRTRVCRCARQNHRCLSGPPI
ncbi:MAG: ADP-ribosylglycohydrolase family protein [Chloroflexi bacterium]|nr:ADP-ribosylglycohydrolase family protein [Chloroflexota bacterium]